VNFTGISVGAAFFLYYNVERLESLRGGGPKLIEDVLDLTTGRLCTDPKDYVYGILGLCHFPTKQIVPDYTNSTSDVYLDATIVMLADAQSLSPITRWSTYDPTDRPKAVPSWVPDIAKLEIAHFQRPQHYNASRGRPVEHNLLDTSDAAKGRLRLRGLFCSAIDAFATPFKTIADGEALY
jgi:hypothetical protein